MPAYEYRCPGCEHEQEAILPWTQCAALQICTECGGVTERRMSLPLPAQSKETGRDHVLARLNRKDGQTFPCQPRDRPRMEKAYAKGLDQTRPVIGVGID